jgi:hypothetical protein
MASMARPFWLKTLWAVLLAGAAFFTPKPALWAADSPALYLAEAKGDVSLVHAGKKLKAKPPQELVSGDRVMTGKTGKAYLQFANGTVVEVGPASELKVGRLAVTPKDFKARFLLAWGKLKASVKKLAGRQSAFEIEAGGVVTGVRGTVFGVDYDKAAGRVSAKTFEGSVFTLVGGEEKVLEKGISLLVGKDGVPVLGKLSASDLKSFKEFSNASGLLNKKKDEFIRKIKNGAVDKVPGGILPGGTENDLKDALNKKLPF